MKKAPILKIHVRSLDMKCSQLCGLKILYKIQSEKNVSPQSCVVNKRGFSDGASLTAVSYGYNMARREPGITVQFFFNKVCF